MFQVFQPFQPVRVTKKKKEMFKKVKSYISYNRQNMSEQQKRLYQPEAINVNEFVYSPPHPNQSGTITNIYMNYNKTRPLIQSPMMFCPFGISVMEEKQPEGAPKKTTAANAAPKRDPGYSVDLQLGTENPRLEAFTKWLESLDGRTLADCQKNSSIWMKHLKGKLSDKMAVLLFKPLVKKYKDKVTLAYTDKYPARCKFKLQRKNGKFTTRVFDHNRNPVDINKLTPEELKNFGKGNRMRIIFEIGGIWTGQKGFGVTLKADQIMLYPPQKLTGFGFLDDVEDELIFGSLSSSNNSAVAVPVAVQEKPAVVEPNSDEEEQQPAQALPEDEAPPVAGPENTDEEEEEQQPAESVIQDDEEKEATPEPSPPKAKKGAKQAKKAIPKKK